jgi:hypothetical protein
MASGEAGASRPDDGHNDGMRALVVPLIEGLVTDPPWQAFLDVLRDALAADYASLVFRPVPMDIPKERVIHLYSGQP